MILHNSAGLDFLHFLRHDAHIKGVVTASVAEAIKFSRSWLRRFAVWQSVFKAGVKNLAP